MADNEIKVLKSNTLEQWRQKSNELSFNLGDDKNLDARLTDEVTSYTATSDNGTRVTNIVFPALPDQTVDNTAGYIILAHGTAIPSEFVFDGIINQSGGYSATIVAVTTTDSKPKLLVKNSTGTFNTGQNLTTSTQTIAHANILRLISESYKAGSVRVTSNGTELAQGMGATEFHVSPIATSTVLSNSPTVTNLTEGVVAYHHGSQLATLADIESSAAWYGTVYHANSTSLSFKTNVGTFSNTKIIRFLGINDQISTSDHGAASVLDAADAHGIELNTAAASGVVVKVISTDLVKAINELQDDIGTVENLQARYTTKEIVTAVNQIDTHLYSSGVSFTGLSADDFKSGIEELRTELGNHASLGTTYTTDTVGAINELETAVRGTLGNYTIGTNANNLVGAINEIEAVFDASAYGISAGANSFDLVSGQFTLDSSADIVLNAESGNVILEDGLVQYSKFSNDAGQLIIYNGNSQMLRGNGGANALFQGTLDVDGNFEVGASKFNVTAATGNTQIDGTLEVDGTLGVDSNTALRGTLTVTNIATFNNNASVAGNFSVNGGTTLGNDTSDDTTVTGDLTVDVNTLLSGTVNIDGATDIDSTLDVLNGTTLRSTLQVNGNTTIDGYLNVGQLNSKFSAANRNNVKNALNELHDEIGLAVMTGSGTAAAGLTNLTAAVNSIDAEIGTVAAYESGTYGSTTISGVLTSLQTGMISNDSGIATNASNISTNASGIATNASNISTNSSGIATINTKLGTVNAANMGTSASTVVTAIKEVHDEHGALTGLTTTAKGTLVAAINENHADIVTNTSNISTINTNLGTVNAGNMGTTASTVVTAIAELEAEIDTNITDISTLEGRLINTGSGLTGGGNLTSNRTLNLDSTVLRTTGNQSVAGTKTFTGNVDLSNANVTFGSGGSIQSFNTQFLTLIADTNASGLRIDRSANSSASHSTSIDPDLFWDETKVGTGANNTSHRAWRLKGFSNANSPVANTADIVTFYNAKDLVTSNTETGISVTWDSTSQNFDLTVNVDNSSIEVSGDNLSIKSGGVSNTMLANSTISGKPLGSNLSTLTQGTGVTLSGGYNGSTARTISIGQPVAVSDSPSFNNLTVNGNLTVLGTNTVLETATLSVEDKNITINFGSGNTHSSANGAGITIQDAQSASPSPIDATMLWNTSSNRFVFSHGVQSTLFIGALSGNATTSTTATKLSSARTFALSGDITGTVNSDLTSGFSMTNTNIGANVVGASELNVVGNGSVGQTLVSDGDGSMTWSTIDGDNTTYDLSVEQTGGNNTNPILRLNPSAGSNDDITLTGSGATSVTRNSDTSLTISSANDNTITRLTGGSSLVSGDITIAGSGATSVSQSGTTITIASVNTQYGTATSGTLGLVKIGYSENNKNYPVELSSGQMYVNVPWVNTEYSSATAGASGLMTAAQFTKLNGIATGATATAAPFYTSAIPVGDGGLTTKDFTLALKNKLDGIAAGANSSTNNVSTNLSKTVSGNGFSINSSDGDNVALTLADTNNWGIMSDEMFDKLDGIATGATATSAPHYTSAIAVGDGGLTQRNFTTTLKNKLDGIATGANVQTLTLKAPSAADAGQNLTAGSTLILTGTGATTTSRSGSIVTINSTNTVDMGDGFKVADNAGNDKFTVTENEKLRFEGGTNCTVTFDSSTQKVTISSVDTNTNSEDYITAASFNTGNGIITGTGVGRAAFTVDIDGRYLQSVNLATTHNTTNVVVTNTGGNNATINGATTGAAGVMSSADKSKLDGIAAGANNFTYALPLAASGTRGGVKIGYSENGQNYPVELSGGENMYVNVPWINTTYSAGDGISLSGTTFNLDSDLRGHVSYVGPASNNYMFMSSTYNEMVFGGVSRFRFSNTVANGGIGTFHADGDIIAFSTTVGSDRKLKDNITVVEGALDKICQLEGVTFDWKRNGLSSAGVIAQDVEKVMPSAVKEVEDLDGKDSHKVVDYNQLSALFIEAIKELKDENKLLKQEIENLKSINKE